MPMPPLVPLNPPVKPTFYSGSADPMVALETYLMAASDVLYKNQPDWPAIKPQVAALAPWLAKLVAALPQILQAVMTILALFGNVTPAPTPGPTPPPVPSPGPGGAATSP